jgi:hypothetical protein
MLQTLKNCFTKSHCVGYMLWLIYIFVSLIRQLTHGLMPPRQSPSIKRSYIPPNDATTYRDLLLFEERLKSNAANLQHRKSRYQCVYS